MKWNKTKQEKIRNRVPDSKHRPNRLQDRFQESWTWFQPGPGLVPIFWNRFQLGLGPIPWKWIGHMVLLNSTPSYSGAKKLIHSTTFWRLKGLISLKEDYEKFEGVPSPFEHQRKLPWLRLSLWDSLSKSNSFEFSQMSQMSQLNQDSS